MVEKSVETRPFVPLKKANVVEKGVFSEHFEPAAHPENYLVSEVIEIVDGLPNNFEDFARAVGRSRDLLSDKRYGVHKFLPETYLVWGNNDAGSECGYIVRRKIEGIAIDSELLRSTIAEQLDEFVVSALEMYKCTADEGGYGVFPDFVSYETPWGNWDTLKGPPKLTNFLVGCYANESQPGDRLFFTDIYPTIESDSVYLGYIHDAIAGLRTQDGSLACLRALRELDKLGYQQVRYIANIEMEAGI